MKEQVFFEHWRNWPFLPGDVQGKVAKPPVFLIGQGRVLAVWPDLKKSYPSSRHGSEIGN
jgi:hypothetical protein